MKWPIRFSQTVRSRRKRPMARCDSRRSRSYANIWKRTKAEVSRARQRSLDRRDRESIAQCDLLQPVEAPGRAGMAGVEIDPQHYQIAVGLAAAQARHPFGRFPIRD